MNLLLFCPHTKLVNRISYIHLYSPVAASKGVTVMGIPEKVVAQVPGLEREYVMFDIE